MRILQIITSVDGHLKQRVIVDGVVYIDVEQPVHGLFGWRSGDFNISEVVNRGVELAVRVNKARDCGEDVVIDVVSNIDGKLSSVRGQQTKLDEEDINSISEEWSDCVSDDVSSLFLFFVQEFIALGISLDWFDETQYAIDNVMDSIENGSQTISDDVNVDTPIDVPMTADVGFSDNSSSYDSGSCGGGDGGGCGGD